MGSGKASPTGFSDAAEGSSSGACIHSPCMAKACQSYGAPPKPKTWQGDARRQLEIREIHSLARLPS